MKKAKRPRGLAARFKQLEIDEIRLSERRAKLERQAMTKGKPMDDYARERGCSRWTIWNRIRDGEVKAVTLKVAIASGCIRSFCRINVGLSYNAPYAVAGSA